MPTLYNAEYILHFSKYYHITKEIFVDMICKLLHNIRIIRRSDFMFFQIPNVSHEVANNRITKKTNQRATSNVKFFEHNLIF